MVKFCAYIFFIYFLFFSFLDRPLVRIPLGSSLMSFMSLKEILIVMTGRTPPPTTKESGLFEEIGVFFFRRRCCYIIIFFYQSWERNPLIGRWWWRIWFARNWISVHRVRSYAKVIDKVEKKNWWDPYVSLIYLIYLYFRIYTER